MSYELPPKEKLREIAARQDAKEKEIREARARRLSKCNQPPNEQKAAAEIIQRNYRGYRERREMRGLGLSASTRWFDAVQEGTWLFAQHPMFHRLCSSSSLPQLDPAYVSR
ncbi:hypothetical protein KCU94_g12594, partial [Aureobasidium melanogenum]